MDHLKAVSFYFTEKKQEDFSLFVIVLYTNIIYPISYGLLENLNRTNS